MKQKLLNLFKLRASVLVALMCAAYTGAWADEENVIFSEQGYENGQAIESYEGTNFTITFNKGTNNNAPKYYTTGAAIRAYGGNYFTVTSDYTMTDIALTFASGEGTNAITTDVDTYENGTWTGSANEVTFTIGGTSGHRRIASVTVTYTTGGTPNPSFVISNNNEVAYDATSGSFDFTVNNPVDGGATTVAEDVDWISDAAVSENSVTFTTTANEAAASREGIITLTYTYGNETVTKNVTVTQAGNPNVVSTIAEVRTQGSGSVVTKGVVTSCAGITAYIQDNSAAICVYGEALTVGDEVKVEGTLTTYKGLLEITSPTVTVLSSGNTVTPEVMTIAEVNATEKQGWLVKIENATVTEINNLNVTLAQEENTVVVRFNNANDITFAVNDLVESLTGNIGCFNTMQIANPTDVVIAAITEPSIELGDNVINAFAEGTNGVIIVDYKNITNVVAKVFFCDADGNATTYDWVTANINDFNNLVYIIDANESEEPRTAYLKVHALDDDANDVYSELITINQAGYVAPVAEFATLPFSFDGGIADIETTAGLTQEGLGKDYNSAPYLKFDGTGDYVVLAFDERPGKLTFDIKGNSFSGGTFTVQTSEDGVTYTDLEAYTELGATQSEEFDNLSENIRYIKWIYTEKASGNVALGNIALAEYTEPVLVASITVEPAIIEATADETEGTIAITFDNLTISEAEDFDVQFYDGEGEETDAPDWILVEVAEDNDNNYVVSYILEANEGEARTAYFKVYAMDDETNIVYSNLVTVNQAEYVAPGITEQYALFTGDLVEGDYIIYYDGYAMNTTVENGRLQYAEVTPENDVITTDNAAIVWHIAKSGEYWTIYNAEADAYAASTGVKNKAQMLADGTDDMALWTFTDEYEFVNKANSEAGVNANLRNNGTYGFACYATATGGALSLYKKVGPSQIVTVTSAGYATLVAESDLEIPAGVKVFTVEIRGEWAHLEPVTAGIPVGAAVVVKAEAGKYVFNYATSSIPEITGNDLIAATEDVTADGSQYVLAKPAEGEVGFYKAKEGSTIAAGKAYLQSNTGSQVKAFYFTEDDATGIEDLNTLNNQNTPIYNLAGQRISKMQKGINIMNGKKVLY